MKNKIHKYDFLIIGAGLIGSLLAMALYQKKFKILLIEKEHSMPNDQRTLAVNANSRDFLKELNIWDKVKNFQEAIEKIVIRDFLNKEDIIFQSDHESMGSVIFNSDLLRFARNYLIKNKILIQGIDYKSLKTLKKNHPILIKNKSYQFQKIILCLGKNHENDALYKKINFESSHRSHVGFIGHQKNHQQIAYEIFTPNGPLALLPSPDSKKKSSTFIYSSKKPITHTHLLKLINRHFKKTHGRINLKSNISSFPIRPHLARAKNPNFILLGDNLRSIHPVAGQGWNLGIKDIQTFCKFLDYYPISDNMFESYFASKRLPENLSYIAFTNILNNLYDNQTPVSKKIIQGAFSILQRSKTIRNIFIKQAMGRLELI